MAWASNRPRAGDCEAAGVEDRFTRARDDFERERGRTLQALEILRQERQVILSSTLWRAARPLRNSGRRMPSTFRRGLRRILGGRVGAADPPHLPTPMRPDRTSSDATIAEPSRAPPADDPSPVLVISGEPETPGHMYRVVRLVDAAVANGAAATWLTVAQAAAATDRIERTSGLIIWRARNCPELATVMEAARRQGVKVVLDLDDLMFRPELANLEVIDGIRSQGLTTDEVATDFGQILEIVASADLAPARPRNWPGTCERINVRRWCCRTHLTATAIGWRAVASQAPRRPQDGLVRIGYAGGSRTHQRDFRWLSARWPGC